jgi:hypothetical protein
MRRRIARLNQRFEHLLVAERDLAFVKQRLKLLAERKAGIDLEKLRHSIKVRPHRYRSGDRHIVVEGAIGFGENGAKKLIVPFDGVEPFRLRALGKRRPVSVRFVVGGIWHAVWPFLIVDIF